MSRIRMTENQMEILDIIQSFRYIPLKVLIIIASRRGLYLYQQSLSRLILKLEDAGYLRGFLYGNNWKVVYITKKVRSDLHLRKAYQLMKYQFQIKGKKFNLQH